MESLAAVRAALVPLAGVEVEIHQVLADRDHVAMYSRAGASVGLVHSGQRHNSD